MNSNKKKIQEKKNRVLKEDTSSDEEEVKINIFK